MRQWTASSMNFERSRFFNTPGTQKGAQGLICLFGQGNGQAVGFWRGLGILGHASVGLPTSIDDKWGSWITSRTLPNHQARARLSLSIGYRSLGEGHRHSTDTPQIGR